MRTEPLDFVGIDDAVDDREAEILILPLAVVRGIGALCYAPFGRTRLWSRVGGRDVPEWAARRCHCLAPFCLKFVVSNPAITAVTPATSRAEDMADNCRPAELSPPNAGSQPAQHLSCLLVVRT